MEKLELKHLAPYLPYELNIKTNRKQQIKRDSWDESEYYTVLNLSHIMFGVQDVVPILRPLDLAKEIKVDGEKFVPIEELQKIFTKRLRFDKDGFYYHVNESYVRKGGDELFPFNQLEAYSYIFKWHFDVFGLIEKGLAISMDDIKIAAKE